MDRGSLWATVHGLAELDTTKYWLFIFMIKAELAVCDCLSSTFYFVTLRRLQTEMLLCLGSLSWHYNHLCLKASWFDYCSKFKEFKLLLVSTDCLGQNLFHLLL